MIDIQKLRTAPEAVAALLAQRNFTLDTAYFKRLEERRKILQTETEQLQAQRNSISKEIGNLKKSGNSAAELQEEVNKVAQRLNVLEQDYKDTQNELDSWLLTLPNLPHSSVPPGRNEQDNVTVRTVGTPRTFTFPFKDQVELGFALGFDPALGAELAGARFTVLKGAAARLHRALVQFMLDLHSGRHGYTEHYTPYIVNPDILYGTGQLPKFAADMYRVASGDEHAEIKEQYLISTAEITLTNTVRGRVLAAASLPQKLTAHSPCFRSEAGSYGKDTRGLIRQHQFDKVEMVQITRPENSYGALEEMVEQAEAVLQALELPYRVVALCSGDMGFAAAKTYDLEIWLPSENTYREISSCSNCEDFQARRMKTRFKDENGKNRLVHTLNGSGVAVGRALIAVLENHQTASGSIYIPPALRPYLNHHAEISAATCF